MQGCRFRQTHSSLQLFWFKETCSQRTENNISCTFASKIFSHACWTSAAELLLSERPPHDVPYISRDRSGSQRGHSNTQTLRPWSHSDRQNEAWYLLCTWNSHRGEIQGKMLSWCLYTASSSALMVPSNWNHQSVHLLLTVRVAQRVLIILYCFYFTSNQTSMKNTFIISCWIYFAHYDSNHDTRTSVFALVLLGSRAVEGCLSRKGSLVTNTCMHLPAHLLPSCWSEVWYSQLGCQAENIGLQYFPVYCFSLY